MLIFEEHFEDGYNVQRDHAEFVSVASTRASSNISNELTICFKKASKV